jgi:hypothetical protein
MAAVIPVAQADVLKTLNLSDLTGKTGIVDLVTAHQPGVMLWLKTNTSDDSYTEAAGDSPSAAIVVAYKLAYSYIMLRNTMEFLNLKTIGKGIIESTGMDGNKTQLISYATIEKKKKTLELQALNILNLYLSEDGKRNLVNLAGRKKNRVQCAILCEEDTEKTTNWWDNDSFTSNLWSDL